MDTNGACNEHVELSRVEFKDDTSFERVVADRLLELTGWTEVVEGSGAPAGMADRFAVPSVQCLGSVLEKVSQVSAMSRSMVSMPAALGRRRAMPPQKG